MTVAKAGATDHSRVYYEPRKDQLPVLLTQLVEQYTVVTTALVLAFITAIIVPIYLSIGNSK